MHCKTIMASSTTRITCGGQSIFAPDIKMSVHVHSGSTQQLCHKLQPECAPMLQLHLRWCA